MFQLLKLLETLHYGEVEFVLVGGAAAYAHGSSMVTQDVDVCGSMEKRNLTRLAKALNDYNPVHRITKESSAFTVEQAEQQTFKNVYLRTDIGQLDFLGSVKGIGNFAEVKAASQTLPIRDFSIRILTLSNLIQAKEAMGRPRDIEAIKILRSIENDKLTDSEQS